ncbi:MAG: hypothetical protein RR053_04390 [Evtepia sp.]
MASSIEELLDILYEMIDEAKNFPLSSEKCVLERDKALDILDEIKGQFPVEFKKARDLLANRNDYIASAKREADGLRKQAEDQVRRMLNEDTVALQARQQADEMLSKADEQSRLLRRAANEYCEETLRRMEESVSESYEEVKRSRAAFRNAAGTATQTPPRPRFDQEIDED